MHCHCGTNNRAPWWTFTDPCKPEVRPGAREESASPAWLAAPAMNARDTTKVYKWRLDTGCGPTLLGSVTSTTHQEKGIITLESNPSRGTENKFADCQMNNLDTRLIHWIRFRNGMDVYVRSVTAIGKQGRQDPYRARVISK